MQDYRVIDKDTGKQPLIVTVDVEPDWGCGGTEGIREVLPRLLESLVAWGGHVTFFVVSDLLSSQLAGSAGVSILREAAAAGHEIGSHGKSHAVLTGLSPTEVDMEISTSRQVLEDSLGVEIRGFRAPFLKGPKSLCTTLERCGYKYDSSVGRVWPAWYNVSAGKWKPIRQGGIVRLPTTTLLGGIVPFSLTYLRLLHPVGSKMVDKRARLLYFHLHEFLGPETTSCLRWPVRWLERRNTGKPAWEILERVLNVKERRLITCWEFLVENGLVKA